ncbi:10650_t:CDS:1, partial [Gigaspora margarita]
SLKSSFNELAIIANEDKPTSITIGIFPKFNKIVLVVGDNVRSRKESQILRAFISSARRNGAEIFFADSIDKLHAKRGINSGKITTR